LYFKGKWQTAFKDYKTKHRKFHLNQHQHVLVPTMQATDHFRYTGGIPDLCRLK